MSVHLRRYTASDKSSVEHFEVFRDQAPFVEPILNILAMETGRDNFIIETDCLAVGFFQIDHLSGLQSVENHLELHEVSIDRRQQGNGYGKAFIEALPNFLKLEYSNWRGVCLTVNCLNKAAKRLYEHGGFTDIGELKLEGSSGPQFIMRRDL